jgi:hypothetical protein
MNAMMNADRPKTKFIMLSMVKLGDGGVVRGTVDIEVGSVDWEVVVSEGLSVCIADFIDEGKDRTTSLEEHDLLSGLSVFFLRISGMQ